MKDTFEICPIDKQQSQHLSDILYASIYVAKGKQKPPRFVLQRPELLKYYTEWGKIGDIGFLVYDYTSKKPDNDSFVGGVYCRLYDEDNKGYGFVDAETPELTIALLKPYRNQGLGTELLQTLIDKLSQSNYGQLSLSVAKANPALRLYQRFGFVIVGEDKHAYTMLLNIG